MASIKVQLNKYRIGKNGTFPLVFQLIHQREKRLIYSPYRLFEKEFDEKKGKVISSRGRKIFVGEINDYIDQTVRQLKHIVQTLKNENESFTTKDIVFMYKSNKNQSLLITFFRNQIVLLKKEKRIGTAGAYESTLNCIIRFSENSKELFFKDITEKWVTDFRFFLRYSGLMSNTVNFYLRILRAVYNKACKEEIAGTSLISPFRNISISNVKTRKIAVNKSVIRKIAEMDTKNNPPQEFARDLFLFSFYCRGMPFVDMAYLTENNIIDGYICYARHKTGQPLSIKITQPLWALINKYKKEGEYILPILGCEEMSAFRQYQKYKNRLRQYNRMLKSISKLLKLDTPLTSYVARHSWATMARENGIPVSLISESMGHSSEKTTYAYLKALDPSRIDDANDKVINDCLFYDNCEKQTFNPLFKDSATKVKIV